MNPVQLVHCKLLYNHTYTPCCQTHYFVCEEGRNTTVDVCEEGRNTTVDIYEEGRNTTVDVCEEGRNTTVDVCEDGRNTTVVVCEEGRNTTVDVTDELDDILFDRRIKIEVVSKAYFLSSQYISILINNTFHVAQTTVLRLASR